MTKLLNVGDDIMNLASKFKAVTIIFLHILSPSSVNYIHEACEIHFKLKKPTHQLINCPQIVHFPNELEASYEEDEKEVEDPNLKTIGGDSRNDEL